jgi:site-specific DNA-methyltransferase (adenine-specific)/modification methylase
MEYMKGLEDNAFDICVTSPPYNMNLRVNANGDGYCSRQIVKEFSSKYSGFDDNLPMEEYEKFLISTMTEILRVSELVFFNIQMITGNKPALFRFMGHFANQIKELVVWDKCKSQPAIGEGVLNSGYELIIILGDKPITRAFQNPNFDRGTLANIWRIPAGKSSDKNHRASFPLSLAETIISKFGFDGARVFDPFLGTGTSAIAAHYGGFDFVGCELDEDYYNAACKRFDDETKQEALF